MRWMMTVGLFLVAGSVAAGCRSEPRQGGGNKGGTASDDPGAKAPESKARAQVTKVVFIGQREACECTRNRIDTTLAALEQVLKRHPDVKLEKLEQDVQQEQADRYDELKPMMVAPGVYLMDGDGKLVELLQGELTAPQLETALGPASSGKS